jgi:hypothetical protein
MIYTFYVSNDLTNRTETPAQALTLARAYLAVYAARQARAAARTAQDLAQAQKRVSEAYSAVLVVKGLAA